MKQASKSPKIEMDLVEYAKTDRGLIPVIISGKILAVIQYNPAMISLRNRVNFISDTSALGKSIANDERVQNVVELFPSIIDLYESQKSLSDLTAIYSIPKKAVNDKSRVSNDNKPQEQVKFSNVNSLPLELNQDNVLAFPLEKTQESLPLVGYSTVAPIRYTNQVMNQPFYFPSFNRGLVSKIQEANDNNYGLRQRVDFSRQGSYYHR